MKNYKLLAAVVALAPLVGCTPMGRNVPCRPLASALNPAAATSRFQGSVFTIVMENHDAGDIFKNPQAPYINSLARDYAVAAGYRDPQIHPSEPNYLWMVAGENFGVTDDAAPDANHVACASHIADQIERAGLDWRSYQESMGEPCKLEAAYPYEPKHNPFVYFDDVNGWDGSTFARPARCTDHVVDYSALDADLAAGHLPRYAFITPNMVDNMHDGTVAQADAWLAREVPKILASPAWQQGGVLFLTWDEGSDNGDAPPMIVISPLAKRGFVSQTPYDTSSFLKTVQAILGLEALPCDPAPDGVRTMDDLFSTEMPAFAKTPIADPANR